MPVVVEVNQGKLKGFEESSVLTKKKFFTFQGIPYAKPPLNDLRFKNPVPLEKWDYIYNATYERNVCLQSINSPILGVKESEDYLYLNISIPEDPSYVKIPKLLYLFVEVNSFLADYLIKQNIVLMTINYRLNVFRFLNLGLPDCLGNVDLKDQVLALKWVKENIRYFGGDPENITLYGENAGATSVHFHMIPPLSKGLFNKCILMNGTASFITRIK